MRSGTVRLAVLLSLIASLAACDRDLPLAQPGQGHVIAASVAATDHAGRHIVLFTAEQVPADFSERVEQLGGTVWQSLDSIGVGVVNGLSESAVATLAAAPDVRAVEPDVASLIAALPPEEPLDDEPA